MASTNGPVSSVDADVASGCSKTYPQFEFLSLHGILAFMIPREKVISSKIDRGAMGGVDSFEDGFA